MKGHAIEIIKDFIISILIVASIGIILLIIFYDDIALGKVIPKAETYILTAEMQNELEKSKLDDAQEMVINYYIDASDLRKYERTNEYVKGKSNPFAEVNASITGNTVIGENTTTSSNTSDNNGSGGFYENDGTK